MGFPADGAAEKGRRPGQRLAHQDLQDGAAAGKGDQLGQVLRRAEKVLKQGVHIGAVALPVILEVHGALVEDGVEHLLVGAQVGLQLLALPGKSRGHVVLHLQNHHLGDAQLHQALQAVFGDKISQLMKLRTDPKAVQKDIGPGFIAQKGLQDIGVRTIKIQFSRCALRSWICDYNSNKIVQFIGQKFWYAA